MRALLWKFAQALLRRARDIARTYTLTRAEGAAENITQVASRNALAWLLTKLNQVIEFFPYLHPAVAEAARTDLDRLIKDLIAADLRGAT